MQGSRQINITKALCLIIYVIALTQTGQPIYFPFALKQLLRCKDLNVAIKIS